jgi:hypothetical protein
MNHHLARTLCRQFAHLLGIAFLACSLPGCAVVSVAASVASTAVSVAGTVVSTGVSVTGKAVEKAIDVAVPDDKP